MDSNLDMGASPSGDRAGGLRPEPAAQSQPEALIPSAGQHEHCDDYIDDLSQPECLRAFLDYARSPAHGATRDGKKPALFATHEGERVRVVMASRFGDVGITTDLNAEYGYQKRVGVSSLSQFSPAIAIEAEGRDGVAGSVHESAGLQGIAPTSSALSDTEGR